MKINKLAIVTIIDTIDKGYLQGCIDSMPDGIEAVVMYTHPTNNKDIAGEPPTFQQRVGYVSVYDWFYYVPDKCEPFDYERNKFSFSEARNVAKSLTDADVIISLDADERLSISENELRMLKELPKDVGGVFITMNSITFNPDGSIGERSAIPMLRIFRRSYDYVYRCHEQVIYNIQADGLRLIDSTIMIKHLGYLEERGDRVKQKTLRNIALISSDLAKDPTNTYLLGCAWRTIRHAHKYGYYDFEEKDLPQNAAIMDNIRDLTNFGVVGEFKIDMLMKNIRCCSQALTANPRNAAMLKAQFINLYTYNLLDSLEATNGTYNN